MPRSGCLALHGVNPNLKKKNQQRKLFWPHGEQQLKTDTKQHIYRKWQEFCSERNINSILSVHL